MNAPSVFPILIKVDEAQANIATIRDDQARGSAAAFISSTQQFFQEQPSQLTISFDMAFLAEIFQGRFREIAAMWNGEYYNIFDELPGERGPVPVPDPTTDTWEFGVRAQQAYNYSAVHRCERTGRIMRVLSTSARTRQNPLIRYIAGHPTPPVMRPEYPVDHLFLVMAADYALRPGQELPRLLSGGSLQS